MVGTVLIDAVFGTDAVGSDLDAVLYSSINVAAPAAPAASAASAAPAAVVSQQLLKFCCGSCCPNCRFFDCVTYAWGCSILQQLMLLQ